MSPMRKRYMVRLVLRCAVLILCGILWAVAPEEFDILTGTGFFHRLSPLHLLWADLVSLPADDENQVLHHLPDFQLGPSDDVLSPDFYGRVLWTFPCGAGSACLAGVGTEHPDASGALLGQVQYGSEVLSM